MGKLTISAFLPTYNEDGDLEAIYRQLSKVLSKMDIAAYEIIIVNDGSTDTTGRIAKELADEFPFTKVVEHSKNSGYGVAIRSGIATARYEYVFFSDSDGQFDFSELPIFAENVPRYDAVIGYRATRNDNFLRKFNAWLWNQLVRHLFGLTFRDVDCAFKLFKREIVSDSNLTSTGAMISVELLMLFRQKGYRVKELPVKHYPRLRGKASGARFSVITKAFLELFHYYRSSRQNVR